MKRKAHSSAIDVILQNKFHAVIQCMNSHNRSHVTSTDDLSIPFIVEMKQFNNPIHVRFNIPKRLASKNIKLFFYDIDVTNIQPTLESKVVRHCAQLMLGVHGMDILEHCVHFCVRVNKKNVKIDFRLITHYSQTLPVYTRILHDLDTVISNINTIHKELASHGIYKQNYQFGAIYKINYCRPVVSPSTINQHENIGIEFPQVSTTRSTINNDESSSTINQNIETNIGIVSHIINDEILNGLDLNVPIEANGKQTIN